MMFSREFKMSKDFSHDNRLSFTSVPSGSFVRATILSPQSTSGLTGPNRANTLDRMELPKRLGPWGKRQVLVCDCNLLIVAPRGVTIVP
jgi:hypothetical protein